ncbi:MAG: hypothetical protein K8F59_02500 [Rhodobacteraceae bacterium]|nr:hypothetical protein [Paracoccaceae bacterium]
MIKCHYRAGLVPAMLVSGLVTALLSGCGGVTVGPLPSAPATVTETVEQGDLTRATYDSVTDTLTIESLPFDNGLFAATYTRAPALDVNGFRAYVNTNGARSYVALWGISNGGTGAVSGGTVGTGDYVGYGHGGSIYGRTGTTTVPTTGIGRFTGRYAGLMTFDGTGGIQRTEGDLNLDVDFADARVEGVVNNRMNVTTATAQNDVILATTTIVDGRFTGGTATSYDLAGDAVETGTYEGLIGGATGLEVAGVIILDQKKGGAVLNATRETGIFVSDAVVVLPTP